MPRDLWQLQHGLEKAGVVPGKQESEALGSSPVSGSKLWDKSHPFLKSVFVSMRLIIRNNVCRNFAYLKELHKCEMYCYLSSSYWKEICKYF